MHLPLRNGVNVCPLHMEDDLFLENHVLFLDKTNYLYTPLSYHILISPPDALLSIFGL